MTEKQVESGGSQSAEQILEPWFGTAFSRLSEPIQKLAAQVVDPRKWHELRPTARRKAAQSFDLAVAVAEWKKLKASLPPRGSQPANPEDEAAATIAWYDATLDAGHRFRLRDVQPAMAAMLLCQHATLEQARVTTTLCTCPADFNRLLERFEDLAKCEPMHRSLQHWLEIARNEKLRYDPWVDEYLNAVDVRGGARAAGLIPADIKPEHGNEASLQASQARDAEQSFEETRLSQPVQRRAAQDQAILSKLRELSHDPRALPMYKAGKPGVKAKVRAAIGSKGMWVGPRVFDKAWERLSQNKEIAYRPLSP